MKQNKIPENKPLFIGITGGVGAGKSEILSFIKAHYLCDIYLADRVAEEIQKPGTDCYYKLVELLGSDILESDCVQSGAAISPARTTESAPEINRPAMAAKIFADKELLSKVNNIIHPAVKIYLCDKLAQARQKQERELFFVEAALLVECGYKKLVDEMWYVYARPEVRENRLKQSRGYSEEKIKNIMEKQLSEEEFRRNCDFVIDNSDNLTDTYRQIKERLEQFTWLE